jgi:ParB-like chromosome segregation protein Spo0J
MTLTKTIFAVEYAPLAKVRPNPYQPLSRLKVDEATLRELGYSFLVTGLIQNPVARIKDDLFQIGDGWLRYSSYEWLTCLSKKEYKALAEQARQALEAEKSSRRVPEQAEFASIPLDIRELSDQQMADLIGETQKRKSLNPIERAQYFATYLEQFPITQAAFGKRLDISQPEIANTIRLLELPEAIRARIISQEITESAGRALLALNDNPKKQEKFLNESQAAGWSVNELTGRIQGERFDSTKSLTPQKNYYDPNTPRFDITPCKDCEHQASLSSRWSPNRKEPRCNDPDCWKKKQKDAMAAESAGEMEKIKQLGIEKIYGDGELIYNQYEYLQDWWLKDHLECKQCDKRAAKKQSRSPGYDIVCPDKECYHKKQDAGREQQNAALEEEELKEKQRITAAVERCEDENLLMSSIILILSDAFDQISPQWFDLPEPPEDADDIDIEEALQEALDNLNPHAMMKKLLAGLLQDSRGTEDILKRLENPTAARPVREKIPDGVRLRADVPDNECGQCTLQVSDHTIGMKFQSGKNSFHCVCTKDYRAWEKKQGQPPTIEPTIPITINPKPGEYILNHTYRFDMKIRTGANIPDVTAKDLETAIFADGLKPEDIAAVRVWKSSGKPGTGGQKTTAGWGKCLEPMQAAALEVKPAAQKFTKSIRCFKCGTWTQHFEFQFDPAASGESHFKGDCPDCHKTHYIENARWDAMLAGEKPPMELSENPDPFADLVISTAIEGRQHAFKLGDMIVYGDTLKECAQKLVVVTLDLLTGETIGALKKLPATPNTTLLIGILEGKEQ